MKLKACIAWTLGGNGARAMSTVRFDALYLSGAISNNPNYKRDFEKAYKALSDAGYAVISPLRICRDDWDWKGRMQQCIKAVALGGDAIVFIPTPFYSRRMEVEIYIARNLDMPVKTVENWIKRENKKWRKVLCIIKENRKEVNSND